MVRYKTAEEWHKEIFIAMKNYTHVKMIKEHIYGISPIAATDELKQARQQIERMTEAGDKMAESIDKTREMMEADGTALGSDKKLTEKWRRAKQSE